MAKSFFYKSPLGFHKLVRGCNPCCPCEWCICPPSRCCRAPLPPSSGNPTPLTYPIKAVYLGYSDLNPSDFASTIMSAVDYGYNLIVLAFWIRESSGVDPYSAAYYWSLLDSDTQKSLISYANSKGARIIVSAGGSSYGLVSTDYALNGGSTYGAAAANFAKNQNLNGVDFDFENFTNTFGTPSGLNKEQTIQWLADATITARNILGTDALITHAPQSPYFNIEFSNGYFDFYKQLPATDLINFFLIQYYNQGNTYLTYESQFINDDNYHPQTAVAQLIERGIPKEVIIVGKLMQPADGQSSSWVDPATLHDWITKAQSDPNVYNWNTGVSTWQWHTAGEPNAYKWINTIYPS